MIELLLRLCPVQELKVVDQQDVNRAELVLERQRIGAAQRFDELIAEALGREIQHLRGRCAPLHFPCDGVQKVRFAEAHRGMNEQRIATLDGTPARTVSATCMAPAQAIRLVAPTTKLSNV